MKKSHYLFLFSSVAMVITGTFLYAFFAYKDSWIIRYGPATLMAYGWIAILFLLAAFHPRSRTKETNEKSNWQWVKNKCYYLLYFAWLFLMVENYLYLTPLKNKRINYVLATQPVGSAVATVRFIEERWIRYVPTTFAVIEYQTETGLVQTAFEDNSRHYVAGQKINIRYSVDNPSLFAFAGSKDDPVRRK